MKLIPFLILAILLQLSCLHVKAQLSLRDPLICHDKEGRLVCYNDGWLLLQFANNGLSSLRTVDSLLQYDETKQTFQLRTGHAASSDGIVIIRMAQKPAVIVSQEQTLVIDSNSTGEKQLSGVKFQVKSDQLGSEIYFGLGNSRYRIRIYDWVHENKWHWMVAARQNSRDWLISRSYRHNRVETILVNDDSLRRGLSLSTNFKTNQGIWKMDSGYFETVEGPEFNLHRRVDTDPIFHFVYDASGRLRPKKSTGAVKQCSCE